MCCCNGWMKSQTVYDFCDKYVISLIVHYCDCESLYNSYLQFWDTEILLRFDKPSFLQFWFFTFPTLQSCNRDLQTLEVEKLVEKKIKRRIEILWWMLRKFNLESKFNIQYCRNSLWGVIKLWRLSQTEYWTMTAITFVK